jgi:hypothetical protein
MSFQLNVSANAALPALMPALTLGAPRFFYVAYEAMLSEHISTDHRQLPQSRGDGGGDVGKQIQV